jgi:uncharacterized membrane-anchored protein
MYDIAVLVDSTLFILFGKGLSGSFAENAILTIDVSNPSSIRYSEIYKANVNINNGTGNTYTNNSTDGSNEEGLSKGAIGGIAAGSVVGVGFCVYLKHYISDLLLISFIFSLNRVWLLLH